MRPVPGDVLIFDLRLFTAFRNAGDQAIVAIIIIPPLHRIVLQNLLYYIFQQGRRYITMKPRNLMRLLICIFIPIQLWIIHVMVNHPYIGVDVRKINNEWTVSGKDIKASSNIYIGDIIHRINGSPANEYSSIVQWRSLEKSQSIELSRNGVKYTIDTSEVLFTLADTLGILGEILSLFVAFMLFRWMKYSRSAQYLSLLFFNIGVTFMSLGASIRGDPIGKSLINTCIILLPIVLMHFFIVFFTEKGGLKLKGKFLRIIYAFILIDCILTTVLYLFKETTYTAFYFNNLINVPLFMIGVLLNLFLLIKIFVKFRKSNKYISTIIKTIFVFLIISFAPLVLFSFLPGTLYGHDWIDPFYTSWAVLLFPLSFTYLLASKKLYDIELVIRRFIFTTILSFLPGGILTGVIAFLFPFEVDAGRLVIVFVLFVIFLSLTLYSFEYVTTKLERVIFPRKHQLQESLKMIARNLGNISSFRELKDIILVDIIETMQVFGGAIVLRYPDAEEELIREGELEKPSCGPGQDWLEDPALTWFEVNRNEEYECYLVLTEKKANTQIGFEETQWLKLIISYLSVSLENLHLIRKLTIKLEQLAANLPREEESAEFAWFRKLMFELQEKERVRIATDLHDTTMQDLFFLKRRCASLLEDYALPPKAIAQVNGIIEYIDVINMNLRQSCFELHPYLLKEIGLVRTIQKLVDLEASTATYGIEFHAGNTVLIESFNLDFKRHLFRMVQELINNAKKHAAPSSVRIEFSVRNSRLYLFYEDDGVGFDMNADVLREIGSSRSGMEYMKSRVLSLNGHFEIITSKGNGFRFMADFPLAEGRYAS